ncbi:MAG TPA: protein kinase [Luteitalea sp.]|nr:protein kinase [Luteitalea sp.]
MLQPGSRIGRYEIQRKLARGGMGTVYVAQDPVLGRMVALKVFLGDLDVPDAAERFGREARAAAALNHSNIVTIFDFGEVDSQPYIVMEYIQGETLAEFITRKTPVPLIEKLRWLEELCAGVASAHKMDVVHRDIKPSNLMIDRSGRLKILDFGIAKLLGSLGSAVTAVIGTPGYMAPEQLLGQPVDGRTDLFSIGIVAFELLTYREAFSGDTFTAITHRIINEDVRYLGDLVPEAPPELCDLVARAVQKDPALRYQDADSLRIQLGRVRRQLESHHDDDGADAPTIISPIALPVRRVTGADEQPSLQRFRTAELTPPPNPTTQREAQARVRARQIASALELGESSLQSGDLEAAREACVQIRALDAASSAAADLERRLREVEVRQEAAHLLAEARTELARGALTTCRTLLDRARERDPQARDPELERDLRMARAEQERRRHRAESVARALTSARDALAVGDDESALAWAREALSLAPEAEEATAIEAQALARLQELGEREAQEAEAGATASAPAAAVQPASRAPLAAPPSDVPYEDDAPTIVTSLPAPRLTSASGAPPLEPAAEPRPVRATGSDVASAPPPPPLPPIPAPRPTPDAALAPASRAHADAPGSGPMPTSAPVPVASALADDATGIAPGPALRAPAPEPSHTRKEPLTVRDPAAHPVPPRAVEPATQRAGSPARSATPRPAAPVAASTGPVPTPRATSAPLPVALPATHAASVPSSSPVTPATRTPAVTAAPAKAPTPAGAPAGARPAGGTLTKTQQLLVVGVLGVVFLVAAILILMKLLGGSGTTTVQQGAVVLEALPWAQVTAITDSEGVNQLATPAPTPFSTTVPVGRYTVTFRGPSGAERTVTVDVAAEGIAVAPVARFEDVSGQTYFDKYFKPATPPPAVVPEAGTPAALPAGGQQ